MFVVSPCNTHISLKDGLYMSTEKWSVLFLMMIHLTDEKKEKCSKYSQSFSLSQIFNTTTSGEPFTGLEGNENM